MSRVKAYLREAATLRNLHIPGDLRTFFRRPAERGVRVLAGAMQRLNRRSGRGDQLGNFDVDYRSLPFAAGNVHAEVAAIKHAQALVDIAEADPFVIDAREPVFGDAGAVVFHFDDQAAG